MDNILPDIFNTPMVPGSQDTFWTPLSADIIALSPKDTLVISTPFLQNSQEDNQLIKMLGACKLHPGDYNVVCLQEGQQVAWYNIKEQLRPTKVLLLGILPAQLGVAALFVPHEINRFDEVIWMPTFGLDNLLSNTALKQHLWTQVFQKAYF